MCVTPYLTPKRLYLINVRPEDIDPNMSVEEFAKKHVQEAEEALRRMAERIDPLA
jgi:hypothetical protein